MTSVEAIASAIRSFSAKVSELREAYNEVEAHAPSAASSLRWGDLEAYISAAEKSVTERFQSLESRARCLQLSAPPDSAAKHDKPAEQVTPRPEIRDFCVNMDAIGLRTFLSQPRIDLHRLQYELAAALRLASNPARIVLDAVENFNPHTKEIKLRTGSPYMTALEALRIASPEIGPEEKQRAKILALELKKVKYQRDTKNIPWFLRLVMAFKLKSEFDADDILDIIVLGAKKISTLNSCKRLGIDDQYPVLIHKLMKKNKHVVAVRYICSLGLAQKIDPAHVLEDYIKNSKHVAAEILKKDPRLKQRAQLVQIRAIKQVMRAIDKNKLICHLTKESLAEQMKEIWRSS